MTGDTLLPIVKSEAIPNDEFLISNQITNSNDQNQKALAGNQDSLARRPMELNHIPSSGTDRVLNGSQNRLTSASPNLRNNNLIISENKNNPENNLGTVSGSLFGNTVPLTLCYFNYNKPEDPVKPLYKMRTFVTVACILWQIQ